MSVVALIKCASYRNPELEAAVRRAVDLVGGMGAFVKPGQRVLIKPNMLSAHKPERQVTTHPAVVLSVGRMILEAGGRPFIADSPALDRFSRVAAKTGLADVAHELDIEIEALSRPTRVATGERAVYKSLELSAQALEADVVINLPKLKTHSQMLLTLGVKNLFGTVVAQRKAEWHGMAGMDREVFASLLLDIYRRIGPALTILDGVWGMEGRGPANGAPRFLGLIAASPDALSLDLDLCRLLGVPLRAFPLFRAARNRGLVDPDLTGIRLTGDETEIPVIRDFKTPGLETLMGVTGLLGRVASRHLVSKPVQKKKACVQCEKCTAICPAEALVLNGSRLSFDYDKCIRCFCCQEVCPQDAIDFRRGPVVRLLSALGR